MADKKDDDSLFTAEAIRNLIDLGGALGGPITSGGGVFAVVPQGWEMRSLDAYQAFPRRPISHPNVQTSGAFIQYVNAFKQHAESELQTVIFVDRRNYDFLAILDYHKEQPGFGEHCVTWSMRLAPDFIDWREKNEKMMGQAEFALFVEDHLPNIANPEGAALLEMIQDLELTKNVAFKSVDRLRDGSRVINYEETVQKSLSKGKLEFPQALKLVLPIFDGGIEASITANLRFRVHEGNLGIFFKLMRYQETIDRNLEEIADDIHGQTNIPVWPGTRR